MKMKIKEIRSLTDEEILRQEKIVRDEIFKLNLQQRTGQLKKTAEIKKTKKTLARILTIINEKKLKNRG